MDWLVVGAQLVCVKGGGSQDEPCFLSRSPSPRTFSHLHAQKRRRNAGAVSLPTLGMEPTNARTPVFSKGHP